MLYQRTLLLCLLVSGCASAAAIALNGTCPIGNCAAPDVLARGSELTTPFDLTYVFPNSDRYQITGTMVARNTGGTVFAFGAEMSAIFLGNDFGTASETHVLTVEFLQRFDNATTGRGNFNQFMAGSFRGPVSPASSVEGRMVIGSSALPSLGPVSPPPDEFALTGSGLVSITRRPVLFNLEYTLTFGAGSNAGAAISTGNVAPSSAIPEPSTALTSAASILIVLAMKRRCGNRS